MIDKENNSTGAAGLAVLDAAVGRLRAGDVVGLPTETVYGLAADATNADAVARIYAVKGRPAFNPLIVHVLDAAAARRLVHATPLFDALAGAFWPGPLTLVARLRGDTGIVPGVTAGLETIAVRVPAHPVAQGVLAAVGRPLAAPSANRSGRISPTTAAHVRAEFGETDVMVLEGGAATVGLESTIVDVTGARPRILRPGAITDQMIARAVDGPQSGSLPEPSPKPPHEPSPATTQETTQEPLHTGASVTAPGQLASHYAPRAAVRLNATEWRPGEAFLAFGRVSPVPSGAMSAQTSVSGPVTVERGGTAHPAGIGPVVQLSAKGDLHEAAANLFNSLRMLDATGAAVIAVAPIPNEGIGVAINDRLRRAAAPRPQSTP